MVSRMVYCDRCSKCELREFFLDSETKTAKDFYQKYGTAYIFACGAMYNPELMKTANRFEVAPTTDCMLAPVR